jgi:hypothetical protein
VYDLRDLIRKIATSKKVTPAPTAAEIETSITGSVTKMVKPEGKGAWGTLEDQMKMRNGAAVVSFGGVMVVIATAQTQRMVAGALQELGK